jgi:hypothetical protein
MSPVYSIQTMILLHIPTHSLGTMFSQECIEALPPTTGHLTTSFTVSNFSCSKVIYTHRALLSHLPPYIQWFIDTWRRNAAISWIKGSDFFPRNSTLAFKESAFLLCRPLSLFYTLIHVEEVPQCVCVSCVHVFCKFSAAEKRKRTKSGERPGRLQHPMSCILQSGC